MPKITTKSAEETQKFARRLAKKIVQESDSQTAIVIGLFGDLGAGKTVFCQGFAKGIGISKNVHSPTFVIMKTYKLGGATSKLSRRRKTQSRQLIHIDAYRLQNPKELLELGWNELVQNPQNIILVEWADKIKKILPKDYIQIKLKLIDKEKRKIMNNKTK